MVKYQTEIDHKIGAKSKNITKQESPPVWTQEAYWPRCIKYYSRWGTPLSGYPPARFDGGVPKVGCPQLGYPQPGPMGGWGTTPSGYPLARTDREGVPQVRYLPVGVPPWPGPTGGTPPSGYPLPGPGRGTPIGVDRRTYTCQNITFLHTTYAVSNKKVLLHES